MAELDEKIIEWEEEAKYVIQDVGFALKSIAISSNLPQTKSRIYFNIETREGQKLCVELSANGFRVVSDTFDKAGDDFPDKTYYETPYALFDKYSNEFRNCFSAELIKRLSNMTQLS